MFIKTLVLLTALAYVVPAAATDLNQTFTDQDGHTKVIDELARAPAERCDGKAGGPCLTLGKAIFHALLTPYADEGTLSGEDKFKRGALAMRLLDKKDVAFSPQDVIMIKGVIGKLYSPLIVVQAYRMLDPSLAADGK